MAPKDGTWLVAAMERRGYTYQSDAIRAMARDGIKVDPSTFSAWASGARTPKPSNRTYRRVVEFFGYEKESPAVDATPTAGLSELVSLQSQLVMAFETQAQAVMDLVQEIRLSRQAETEDILARLRAVEATQRILHPELAEPESEALPVPRQTRE